MMRHRTIKEAPRKPGAFPAPVSCLMAIQNVLSRNAAVWTMTDDCHSSCDGTYELFEAATEQQPTSIQEALFLVIAAANQAHVAEDTEGAERKRAQRCVRTALYNVVDFLIGQGVEVCPMVRDYFLPPCNHPQLSEKERQEILRQSDGIDEELARAVFARLGQRAGRAVRS
jgi:hypothetical protein